MDHTPVVMDETVVDLRHRNQFILGPELPHDFDAWKQVRVGGYLSLATHRELGLAQVTRQGRQFTCAGYMLDPFNPRATEVEILDDLAGHAGTREAALEQVSRMGGRWVLICEDGDALWLVTDALGHRQVFYTDGRYGEAVWCASHPRLIADALGLEMDKAAGEFIDEMLSRNAADKHHQRDRWFPGVRSPYAGVRRLTPNHYLDLRAQAQHRFWPNKPLTKRSLDNAVEEGARVLQGLVVGAATRFDDLALMITSGLDSRLVLAASRSVADRLRYMTIDYPLGLTKGTGLHGDVDVPATLLPKLGLKHEVVYSQTEPSPPFREMYKEYILMPNDFHIANAEACLPFFNRRTVAITGSASGPFIAYYRIPWLAGLFIHELSPDVLAHFNTELEGHPFAIQALAEWLAMKGNIYDYNMLDIFFWEQRTSNWQSDWAAGFDYVWRDTLAPLNCRYLYDVFLGVEESQRQKPAAKLHWGIIKKLWPELLALDDSRNHPTPAATIKSRYKITRKNLRKTREFLN